MTDAHGIIFAYSASPDLGDLVRRRTASSMPFGGRYRLVDFALSSMMNAGIYDVGVILQRDYQSLLNHVGSGKVWDMSRKTGGLKILPPFGLPEYHRGNYTSTVEALTAVNSYIESIKQKNVVLMLGNICANIDLSEALRRHNASGNEITAICSERPQTDSRYKFEVGEDGNVAAMGFAKTAPGADSLECYIVSKALLMRIMERFREKSIYHFHADFLEDYLKVGGKVGVYMHREYASLIRSTETYYNSNMDMLDSSIRRELFNPARPVRTKTGEEASTYYGENATSVNSLAGDNCIIEGSIENCIVFPGVKVEKGAKVSNSILMSGTVVGAWADVNFVIADKNSKFSSGSELMGSRRLPFVVPKGTEI